MKKFLEKFTNKTTLKELLEKKSNDYTCIEQKFNQKTKQSLLQLQSFILPKKWKRIGVSVIIPTFNSNASLAYTLSHIEYACENEHSVDLECIVVDDASKESASKRFEYFQKKFDLKFIRNTRNKGAGVSRCRGVDVAKNEILIFLDSDTIPTQNFFTNHAYVHFILADEDIILVSFREKVKSSDERLRLDLLENNKVDISNDFRVKTTIRSAWTQNPRYQNHEIKLLKKTKNWKNFGNGKQCAIWTLPMMGITSALSCRRSLFKSVDFHPELFWGWGFEDSAMCAALIAHGAYLIPNFNSSVLHINHTPRSGNNYKKMQDFLRNKKQYMRFLNSIPLIIK
jgi:glycosyltransferase involved in cell wall biosynthesis